LKMCDNLELFTACETVSCNPWSMFTHVLCIDVYDRLLICQ